MKRSEGERVRMRQAISNMRAHLQGLEVALGLDGPIGQEASQGIVMAAFQLSTLIAKHDAYDLAEQDEKKRKV